MARIPLPILSFFHSLIEGVDTQIFSPVVILYLVHFSISGMTFSLEVLSLT